MGIALVVLRESGQQILGEVEMDEERGVVTCRGPLSVGWARPDKKLTRILMTLSVFPALIDALADDLSGHHIALRATDILCIIDEPQLKPQAVADYVRRRQECYGKIAVVSAMQGLKGEA